MQPPTEASSCTGSPRAPRKITAHGCAPAPQPRGGGGGAHPNSCGSPGQDADEHPAPSQRGKGVGFPPKQAPSPTADSKAPSGEGKSSALPEAQETPLSQGSSWTVRFKDLFHSGKRKARVKRKSAGQRCRIPAPGARHSAPRAARSPQNPATSPPSVGTLAHAPALTPFLTEGSSSHRQWVGARAPSRPLRRIQSWIALPMPLKPHLEKSKRRYCWFSFPWPPCLQLLDSGPVALREEGCSCCPHSPG